MKRFVSELKENEHVEDVFYVTEKMVGVGKTGKTYLSIKVMDKTGVLDAKIWDRVDMLNGQFDRDEFVSLKANVQSYQGNLQLVVTDISRVQASDEIRLEDFTPDSGLDIDGLWNEFVSLGAAIADPHVRRLFEKLFVDDGEIREKFKTYPAAKSLHHSYKGGLLEHSLNVARLASRIHDFYGSPLNRDILVFSALVHDLGKIWELAFSFAANYTDEGKLLGHIVLADEALTAKARQVTGFPSRTLTLIRHILLSHHGEYEFGSPKRPKTIEALVIHFLDNLDAKLNGFLLAVNKDVQSGDWTSIVRSFDRQLYKGVIPPVDQHAGEIPEAGRQPVKKGKEFNPVLKKFSFELFRDKE